MELLHSEGCQPSHEGGLAININYSKHTRPEDKLDIYTSAHFLIIKNCSVIFYLFFLHRCLLSDFLYAISSAPVFFCSHLFFHHCLHLDILNHIPVACGK